MSFERIKEKLEILADAAKYDISCSSSGSKRKNKNKGLGNSDGTLEGFFTCIFIAYDQKLKVTSIFPESAAQAEIFSTSEVIITDREKAQRVKKSLNKWISARGRKQMYFAFLSEISGNEMLLYRYIQKAIGNKDFSA